jgi:membrane-associated protein
VPYGLAHKHRPSARPLGACFPGPDPTAYPDAVTSLANELIALGPAALDPERLAISFGLFGVLAIVFAECGLLIGFFLPGDSLLFAVGLLIAGDRLNQNVVVVAALISVAAIAGNFTGYFIGAKAGPAVFSRPQSKIFKPEYVTRSQEFFDKYGPAALILARFTPIVRTVIPVMAGTSKMNFTRFAIYSSVGGVVWAFSMTTLGYFLGQIEWVQKNLEIITLIIVIISVVPIVQEIRKFRNSTSPDSSS